MFYYELKFYKNESEYGAIYASSVFELDTNDNNNLKDVLEELGNPIPLNSITDICEISEEEYNEYIK